MASLDLTKPDGWFSRVGSWLGVALRREAGSQHGVPQLPVTSAEGVTVNADSVLSLPATWACLRVLSQAVASMPVVVSKVKRDGSKKKDTEHDLHMLLNFRPNSHQTPFDFWSSVVINLLLFGNAYVRVFRSGEKVVSLVPMMAAQMEVFLAENGRKTFVYKEGGQQQEFTEQQIWHVQHMSSNGVSGLSAISYAASAFAIAIASERRVGHLAANGFKQSGVLTYDKVLTKEQRANLRESFSDIQTGYQDTLRILEAGMSFVPVSQTPKDAQMIETRQKNTVDICQYFGVPPIMIGETSGNTTWGSGIYEIKQGFYDITLRPLLVNITQSLIANLLGRDKWGKVQVEFDFTDFLRNNEASQLEMLGKAVKDALVTPNEARGQRGLEPLEGGDTLYMQQQMTPIEKLGEDPEPDAQTDQTPEGAEGAGDDTGSPDGGKGVSSGEGGKEEGGKADAKSVRLRRV